MNSESNIDEKNEKQYPGICKCPCHKGAYISHPVPCCEPCPKCGKLIERGSLHLHEPFCSKKK